MSILLRSQLSTIINQTTNDIFPSDLVHIIIEYVSSIYIENLISDQFDGQTDRYIFVPIDMIYFKMSQHNKSYQRIEELICDYNGHWSRFRYPSEIFDNIKNNILVLREKDIKAKCWLNINCSHCKLHNTWMASI